MSEQAVYRSILSIIETIESGNAPAVTASQATIKHEGFNTVKDLDGSSTPVVTKAVAGSVTLSAGAATLDLTALAGTNGLSVDGTGLKVQAFKFKVPAGNAAMTIAVGLTNGYDLAGGTFTATLGPDGEILVINPETAPDISGTEKTIDVTGTGTEVLNYVICMG